MGGVVSVAKPVSNVILVEELQKARTSLVEAGTRISLLAAYRPASHIGVCR